MKSSYFLIKPASGLCNMRCRYCFYQDETAVRAEGHSGIMSDEMSELLIWETFAETDPHGEITFAFQGGEPTLAGIDYFRHFTDTVKKANDKHVTVHYAIQTNGLNVDEEWAAFFRDNHFLTGISLDGDKSLHDRFRPDPDGKGTYSRVRRSVDLLLREKVDLNLLCVVTHSCAGSAVKVYNSLLKTGVRYLQFIPCLDPLDEERGSKPYSLLPEDYGNFLCDLFDAWYIDLMNGRYESIRLFDDYISLAAGYPPGTCSLCGSCGAYTIVEADGSLYPCDFYALDEWRMGKLGEAPLADLQKGETALRFLRSGDDHPPACAGCEWRKMCFGGCKRDWFLNPATGVRENYYCPAFKKFFAYAMPRIRQIAVSMTLY